MSETNTNFREVRVDDLVPSDHNVHAAERPDDEAFKTLAESIKRHGLIHCLTVRPRPDGKYTVVDGHRRLAACKAVGIFAVPVEVKDYDDYAASLATINANAIRIVNDPVLVAEQVERMLSDGKTPAMIARDMGVSETTVLVRARLAMLTPVWREFGKTHGCTIDLLERVASYEPELQNEVAEAVGLAEYDVADGEEYKWSEFQYEFDSRLTMIEFANFDTSECVGCPFNTASQGILFTRFDSMKDARCERRQCYAKRYNARTDELIAKLTADGNPPVEVASKWKVPEYYNATDRRTKKNGQPYVYADNELRRVVWSVKTERPVAAKSEEQKAAEKAERKERKTLNLAFARVRHLPAFATADSPDRDREIESIVATDAFREHAKRKLKDLYGDRCGTQLLDGFITDMVAMCGTVESFATRFGCEFTDDEREAIAKAAKVPVR